MTYSSTRQQLLSMNLYNATAAISAPLRYPAGTPEGPLPRTRRDLLDLDSKSSSLVDVDVINI